MSCGPGVALDFFKFTRATLAWFFFFFFEWGGSRQVFDLCLMTQPRENENPSAEKQNDRVMQN